MDGYDVTLTAVVMTDDRYVLEYVATTPGAVGYVSLGHLTEGARVLAIEGVPPTPDDLSDYPLTNPLLLTARSEPTGEARAFIQWILSPQGQREVVRLLGPSPPP
jgi:phosphate transport system substrate-binding protein